jgi:hypothetical protein
MTTPKYTVDKRDICIVNVSKFNTEDTLAIVLDLNKKGYLVSIDGDDAKCGRGVWFAMYCEDWTPQNPHNDYLDDVSEFYCVKPNAAQKKTLGTKPIHIGNTGEHDVIIRGDNLVVGCQTIGKENAINMCRKILKAFKVK